MTHLESHQHGSVYYLRNCIVCAAVLVRSARPSRAQQEAMLWHVTRFWPREDVIKELRNHE